MPEETYFREVKGVTRRNRIRNKKRAMSRVDHRKHEKTKTEMVWKNYGSRKTDKKSVADKIIAQTKKRKIKKSMGLYSSGMPEET